MPQTNIISTIKQLLNAVSQFLQMRRNFSYATLTFLGKRVIQTNPSERDRQTDRQTETERDTHRERGRERALELELENFNAQG